MTMFMDVCCTWNCDPKKCIARTAQLVQWLGYTMDDPRFKPGKRNNFSLLQNIQTSSGVHPTPYSIGTRGTFPGGKMAAA